MQGWSKKEKELRDMDNSVEIGEGKRMESIRELNGNGKNTVKKNY